MPLGRDVDVGPGDIVLDGDPAPPKEAHPPPPPFSAHVCCGQTAGRIKMLLGREVDLGPGHIVLHGAQLPARKGAQQSPFFRPMSTVAKWSPISATAELL